MNRGDFYASLHTIAPGCTLESVKAWIDFAYERVDAGQYANFTPSENREASMERWLDAFYAGLCDVRREFGAEMTARIVGLSLEQSCLYPYEMVQAAECLRDGGNAETIMDKVNEGEIEGEPPFFFCAIHPLMERDRGPVVGIKQTGVECGLFQKRTEPGYVLRDGTVLLESERDESGCYKGGAGMDGMFLRTGELYRPFYTDDGRLWAFCQVAPPPENYLATAEMVTEQNYNHIDGVINNEAPKPSLMDTLRQYQEDAEKQERTPPSSPPNQER